MLFKTSQSLIWTMCTTPFWTTKTSITPWRKRRGTLTSEWFTWATRTTKRTRASRRASPKLTHDLRTVSWNISTSRVTSASTFRTRSSVRSRTSFASMRRPGAKSLKVIFSLGKYTPRRIRTYRWRFIGVETTLRDWIKEQLVLVLRGRRSTLGCTTSN